ncbi:hypothetical protein A9P82_00725 [Arachidicoccus ginsenosidimutans]|uniref:helix-turn-helix transcriptional regulator n=1 Tax=Arachidicoccus sp. BS20 TaxID=1850526 RepID=UPI0007F16420|nr:WYL domain-containing protein [Arachidicoccus sp. BS20]ANI87967.1 hypothetical protein A9P82_00725 [Arachidicoccus sp. BS20]
MFDKLNILTRIIEKIKRFPVTFESMREWIKYENIEISDRTLYRYLKEAEELRMNDGRIITIEGDFNKKTWKFEYDNSVNELKENDIVSFLLLKGFLPNAIAKHRQQHIDKIEEVLFKAQSKSKFEYHLETLRKSIAAHAFGEYDYTGQHIEYIGGFVWAMQHSRKVRLNISGDNETFIGVPMQLLLHKGAVYLMSLDDTSGNKLRTVNLKDVNQFEILTIPFDIRKYEQQYNLELNKRFGVEDNIDENEYDIVLQFPSKSGTIVCNHFWHVSQETIRLPDGKWEMRLSCGINNELINWLIELNETVEILQPKILLDKTLERIDKGLSHIRNQSLKGGI